MAHPWRNRGSLAQPGHTYQILDAAADDASGEAWPNWGTHTGSVGTHVLEACRQRSADRQNRRSPHPLTRLCTVRA